MSSHEQVRADSMGYLENRSVLGPDDWTGVPSHLHDEEEGERFICRDNANQLI